MNRMNVAVTPRARAFQTGALLLVLLGVLGILAHSIVKEHRSGEVAGGATFAPDVP